MPLILSLLCIMCLRVKPVFVEPPNQQSPELLASILSKDRFNR